ncbi:MAG: BLUF domain-containing protein [Betaproteobacteria bacterium]|nr:BLUF domain-containing protein [Betaproteobacteria bacterium]MDE2622895.1 BLUF domain-containing protein [Betaproteobacteria bacterium]
MLRLLYTSQALPAVNEDSVRDILQASRKNNAQQGITGVLVFGGRVFMQVLEGPEKCVLSTYLKITEDVRHSDCRIIHVTPAESRLFDQWTMGVIECDPLEFQHITELRSYRTESVSGDAFRKVMQAFLARLNSR